MEKHTTRKIFRGPESFGEFVLGFLALLVIILLFKYGSNLPPVNKTQVEEMLKSPIEEVVKTGKPVVRPLLPTEKFTLLEDPVQLGNLPVGKVKVQREKDGFVTSFLSSLSSKKGQIVKISRVWHQEECQNGDVLSFCFVE